MDDPLVINLFGGPGSRKSTTASGIHYRLKSDGYNAELTGEYAKDCSWEGRHGALKDQFYVFGKQHFRVFRLINDCDIIISDSPIIMGLAYALDYPECFKETVKWAFNQYRNINFFIRRGDTPYNTKGRNQTKEEAIEKDQVILDVLRQNDIPFHVLDNDSETLEKIVTLVKKVIDIS